MSTHTNTAQWARSWLLTALLCALCLGLWEWRWREAGALPSITDDKALWASERMRAVSGDCDSVALLGASRLNLNFDPQTARRMVPDRQWVHLGVNGHYPLATLQDLAADGFCGIALVSVLAQAFEHQRSWDMQQAWVDYYQRSFTFNQWLDRWLLTRLESALRWVSAERSLWPTLTTLQQTGRWPQQPYYRMLPDRSMQADFSRTDQQALAQHFVNDKRKDYQLHPPSPAAEWAEGLARIADAVASIQARGGQVVFLRFPTSAGHWELDQQYYPRDQYWDQLAPATGAATLHFADYSELETFELPDTSHLDRQDAPAFTEALLRALDREGIFARTRDGAGSAQPPK